MDLVTLTEYLVKSIASVPDMVSVKQFDGEENTITIQVIVDEKDMGVVIGKGGATANAIRTLVQAAAYVNQMGRVRVNIDTF